MFPRRPLSQWRNAIALELGLGAVLGALAQLSALALLAVAAYLISRAWQQPPILYLMVAITSVRLFGISRGVLRYAERLVSHDAAFRGLERLRIAVWRKLIRLAPAGIPVWRSGDLQARVVDDVDGVGDRWLRGALPVTSACIVAAAAVALQATLLPAAGAILAAALLAAALGGPALASWSSRIALRATRDARGDLTEGVRSCLHGREELVAAGTDAVALERVVEVENRLRVAQARIAWTAGLGQAVGLAAMAAALIGALWTGVPAVAAGTLDGVLLAVVALVPLAAFEPVLALPAAAQQTAVAKACGKRLLDITRAPEPRPDPAEPMEFEPNPLGGPPYIEIKRLSVTWPGSDTPALHGFDLTVQPGERVAVMGPSGSGKSTLAAALMGFLPYEGSLRFGGVELSEYDGDDIRRTVGLCSQDAHIFDTTLAENLRLARPSATDDDLVRALRWAGLRDWLDGLDRAARDDAPDDGAPADRPGAGLQTRLGEHGRAVSGGERGRIALARCLLADREVLVLDEPDAHLDAATAARVLRTTAAALEGKTAIVITHRPLPDGVVDRVVHLGAPVPTPRDAPNNRLLDVAPAG
ncbi:thiol reductant ABC exporter subunit CydC [Glycomyces harbinensis]|uniref:ATP-binding cassette, subfamily C, CydC/ATP-binding cassette, subfamily C, CydCD n=1 Tax=Glycomyces harbinensis TaxID=58114 RepID=A0A1G7A2Z8_9ACTN|nr:thiol reductant ABC exporter subunit CydC [Glycomyces harbinensis]SDE09318.1 ATP-binding cassette, subfamily C, CydC/ATP-binding cassette, subfamily C, CydCD [Glycomyces harbinensis]